MQAVPSKRLGKEIGMKDGELSDPEDEVEARIRSEQIWVSNSVMDVLLIAYGRNHETAEHERNVFTAFIG